MVTPVVVKPCSFMRRAATALSTPPLMAIMAVGEGVIMLYLVVGRDF
jgi:hypothetical protein